MAAACRYLKNQKSVTRISNKFLFGLNLIFMEFMMIYF